MKLQNLSALALAAILMFPASTRTWAAPPQDKKTEQKAEAKVVDPVCGMTVDPKTAEKTVYKGRTYYFCNRDDKVAFEKSPEKYVNSDKSKK